MQALVLSGHDHDQCTVTHESKFGLVKEVSIPRFLIYRISDNLTDL